MAAHAEGEYLDILLEKLKSKGVLTDDEFEALKQARDEERLTDRKDRRNRALREARQAEKEEQAHEAAAKQTKFETSPAMRSMQFYGDVRLRFESRTVEGSGANSLGNGGLGGGLYPAGAESIARERWRYAVRLGVRGELSDDWFYGIRLDTGTNPRSPWVTFGGDSNGAASGAGPFGKTNESVQVGQAFVGLKATPWLTVQAGKMPNPMYATPMVWDPDLAPEGLAERLNIKVNDSLDVFGNFMQVIYQDVDPDMSNNNALGFHSKDGYLFAWQLGANVKFAPDMSFRGALSLYNYGNQETFTTTKFKGEGPVPATAAAAPAYLMQQNATNDLKVVDIPVEFNFKLGEHNARVFGDFARNLSGDARARGAGHSDHEGDRNAYLLGFAYGNLGMIYGQVAKKGTWELRTYYQKVQQYALDTNLIDSDFMEGRTNMAGMFFGGAYSFTDGLIGAIKYGYARRADSSINGTGGSNPDIPQMNPIDDFRILQFDLTWRF